MYQNHKSSLKLVMTLLIRDNEDTLRENIEYHLQQGVDFFIAMDNLSVDSSTSILKEYEKKGLLHYIHQPDEGFLQAKWVTQMARLASTRFKADWIINNDADEFWLPRKANSLKELFSRLPSEVNKLCCERNNFIIPEYESDNESGNETETEHQPFFKRMIYKDMQSTNTLGQPLPPKVAHRASRWIKVGAGNHSAKFLCKNHQVEGEIDIFHFPFRDKQQILDKIRLCKQTLAHSSQSSKTFTTWKILGDELNSDEKLLEFTQSMALAEREISKRLELGTLIEDTRLKDSLMQIHQNRAYNRK